MLTVTDIINKKTEIEEKGKQTFTLDIKDFGECEFRKVTRNDFDDATTYKDGKYSDEFLIAATMVEPKLNDKKLLQAYEVTNTVDLVRKLFSFGKIRTIAEKLSEISDFDSEAIQIVDKIKN